MNQPQTASDNSSASQRHRILQHLKSHGPLTTIEARHLLDVMHPGMRICELRKAGYPIVTAWTNDLTPEGNVHRVGQYILLKEAQLSLIDWLQHRMNEKKSLVVKMSIDHSGEGILRRGASDE